MLLRCLFPALQRSGDFFFQNWGCFSCEWVSTFDDLSNRGSGFQILTKALSYTLLLHSTQHKRGFQHAIAVKYE